MIPIKEIVLFHAQYGLKEDKESPSPVNPFKWEEAFLMTVELTGFSVASHTKRFFRLTKKAKIA